MNLKSIRSPTNGQLSKQLQMPHLHLQLNVNELQLSLGSMHALDKHQQLNRIIACMHVDEPM